MKPMDTDIETDGETDKEYGRGEAYRSGDYIQHDRQTPTGHSCCGCCCDTRRAVIVVNIVSISFATLALLSLTLLTTNADLQSQLDDDEVQAFLDEMDGASIGLSIGIAVLGIICNACGIFGAYKFHQLSIVIASIWYVVEMIRAGVYLDPFGVVMAGLFLYPHIVFYRELSSGLMSPISYPNERQCCECCV
ncbi:unnamed protein product [Cylindrotheca closterium]|uniref:Uncharacterized protein n=1 Tax=Cylindrotheca closterium TaxID=2856 RepID=A0AAD2FHD7_9STRA|nr:unnamed protein product [Cylindrotheca closterium]